MKTTLRVIILILTFPFFLLGGLIAILRILWASTFLLAWTIGDDWYGELLCGIHKAIKSVKESPKPKPE